MALADVTVSFDLHDLLGGDFDARRVRAYVTTNVESGTLMDTSTGETRVGDARVTIAADGTGEFTTWAPGADGNPISWQTSLVLDYPRAGRRDRTTRTFGPYTITADADLADLEEEQAVPAEYLTAVTAELDTYVDAAEGFRDQAEGFADDAADSAAAAADSAADAVAIVIADADAAMAAAIDDDTSDTYAALSASIEETGHGLFFAIGSHAARVAPSGGTDTTAIQAALTAGKTAIILDPDRAYAAGALTLSADTVFIGHGTVLTLSATVDSDGHALSFVGVQVVRDEDENATDGPAKNHYVRGGLFVRNDRESVSAVLDVAGFQGQGGSTPDARTFQVHHYCDTDAMWIDNVGSGTNLVLNLSQNSTRRGDLASDYVGTGFWQKLQRHDNGTDAYLNYLQFDYEAATDEARILWPRGRGHLLVNKSDDGGWAYVLDLTNEHANVLTIPGVFRILSDVSKTRTQIASDSGQTNGLYIKSGAGPLTLEAASGVLNFNTQPKWNSASLESTGSGSASLGSNCPATTATAPYKWLKFASSDGSTVYVPAWK